MGISGLIKFVEKATHTAKIDSIRGSSVAVDSYCLLHKGSYSCANLLVQGIKTTAMIDYAMKYVKMLLALDITVIMVFDGRNLKAKALTEKKRRNDREAAKAKATQLLTVGKHEEARKEFSKAVNITHQHALELMEECRRINVNCIVAMYEADAQLSYLNKLGLAEYVISEDSDLILFGCKKIVFKLQLDGSCLIFKSEKLPLVMNKNAEDFSFETFRRICILSGCDYLDSLPGIGLKKATKFMTMTHEQNMAIALYRIPTYLNLKNVVVTDEYIENFLKAEATFKYMYVFDPIQKKMVRLNQPQLPEGEKYCSNAGDVMDDECAYQLALGNLNPHGLNKVNDFDPLRPITRCVKKAPAYIYPTKKDLKPVFNIWTDKAQQIPKQKVPQQSTLGLFFFKKETRPEIQDIIFEENKVEEETEIDDLISSYCSVDTSSMKAATQKRTFSILNDDDSEVDLNSSSNNPFAKRKSAESSLKKEELAENVSLLKSITARSNQNEDKKIVSRFFKDKLESSQPKVKIETPTVEERIERNRQYYELIRGNGGGNKKTETNNIEENAENKISIDEVNIQAASQNENLEDALSCFSISLASINDNDLEQVKEEIEVKEDEFVISLSEDDDDDEKEVKKTEFASILSRFSTSSKASSSARSQELKTQIQHPSTAKPKKYSSKRNLNLKRKASSAALSEASQFKLSKFGFTKKDVL